MPAPRTSSANRTPLVLPFCTASWPIKALDCSRLLQEPADAEILAPPAETLSQGDDNAHHHQARITWDDLYINTKRRGLQRFRLNPIQTRYLDTIWPTWRECGPIPRGLQEIILKSRQFGFSTLIAAIFFLDTVNTPGTTTVVVAHNGRASENLFQIVHRFWRNLPLEKRPHKEYSSKTELFFDQIDSRYLVFTAGGESAAASFTIQNLHCSEAALYPVGGDFWETTEPAVPEDHGNIFIESTARGESGRGQRFCNMYRAAKAKVDVSYARDQTTEEKWDAADDGEDADTDTSTYNARFFAWWEHDEYEVEGLPLTRTDEEQTIANKYSLDALYGQHKADNKLRWRRRRVQKMGALFAQEYPGDDREAFLVSGSRFFLEWDGDQPGSRHAVYDGEVTIERHWQFFGGYDWGYKPSFACFLLACVDARGRVIVVDEEYHQSLTDPEQAAAVLACLERNGVDPASCLIYADPNMWAGKMDWSGKVVQNVAAFDAAGLRMVRAVGGPGSRIPKWANVRRYLHDTDTDERRTPFLRVLRNRCPNLCRTLPLMIHDKTNPEDMESDPKLVEDHAADTLSMLLASRPRPSSLHAPAVSEDVTNARQLLTRSDYELHQLGFDRELLEEIAGNGQQQQRQRTHF